MNVRTSDKKGPWLQKKGQETSSRTTKLYSRRFFAAIPLEASSIWKSFFGDSSSEGEGGGSRTSKRRRDLISDG